MGLDTAATDHACNVVRRQIQEEFPDLTLFYFVAHPGQRAKALESKRREILNHPAGEAFMPVLSRAAEKENLEFSGISMAVEKKLLGLHKRDKRLACFFVDPDKLESGDDARRQALFLAWHALALLEDFKAGREDRFKKIGDVIIPASDKKISAWKNMLADAFSVLELELENRRDSIGKLGRSRSFASLFTVPRAMPENYPFPLVLDAARLVFHDTAKSPGPESAVAKALEMVREIGETFDVTSIRQWWAFVRPAQEMAWLGIDQNIILGAAVYNSEDPYARATAYLVAEALNIQTLTPIAANTYNAFADTEINERHHLKACEDTFRDLSAVAGTEDAGPAFLKEAAKKNRKLLEGNPIGWCTPALLKASAAPPEGVKVFFEKALGEFPWPKIEELVSFIVRLRRQGYDVTPELLSAKLGESEELKMFSDSFMNFRQ